VRERKRELVGRVVSDKMEKTVVVAVQTLRRHRLYQRTVRRTKKFMAHNDNNQARSGDLVRIQESRPISRHKHWRVMSILEVFADRGRAVPETDVVAAPEVQDEIAAEIGQDEASAAEGAPTPMDSADTADETEDAEDAESDDATETEDAEASGGPTRAEERTP
jgi:small subunit ribosomal protein S17